MSQFATTRWSLILQARAEPETAREALGEICRAYRAPVLAYVRRSGHTASDAEDLTQEFFARLLERRWDTALDPARGRFRAFLLTALKRFLADQHDAATAGKRGGGQATVDIDVAGERLALTPEHSPEHAFDRAWALTVLQRAYEHLRAEADAAGKQALFEQLAPFLAETPAADDYPNLAETLGLRANTIAVSVRRLRLRLRELVRRELAEQTSGEPQDVDAELRALRAALSQEGMAAGDVLV